MKIACTCKLHQITTLFWFCAFCALIHYYIYNVWALGSGLSLMAYMRGKKLRENLAIFWTAVTVQAMADRSQHLAILLHKQRSAHRHQVHISPRLRFLKPSLPNKLCMYVCMYRQMKTRNSYGRENGSFTTTKN